MIKPIWWDSYISNKLHKQAELKQARKQENKFYFTDMIKSFIITAYLKVKNETYDNGH